jgi:hypothetical protein
VVISVQSLGKLVAESNRVHLGRRGLN